jgi:hypothetical protein
LAQEKTEELESKISEMTGGAKPGTKEYMSFYQKGLNKLMDKVEENEIDEAKALAEKWNNEGTPDDIKAK